MPQSILGEHVAILDAIIAGDDARAEKLSRDHISRAAKILLRGSKRSRMLRRTKCVSVELDALDNLRLAPSIMVEAFN
jgi:hypothetical protein